MDIGKKVTVTYQLKRGNYAVDSTDRNNITDSNSNTSSSICSHRNDGAAGGSNASQATSSVRYWNVGEQQVGNGLRCEDSVQRISLPTQGEEQTFVGSWSMATDVGSTSLVYIQTSKRGEQVCSTSIRIMVQSVQISPRKELVLNESTRVS
jgi:hypothetical protein